MTDAITDPFAHYAERGRQLVLRQDARLVSHSEVATFKRCRRKWWLAWYRGIRLKHEPPVGVRAVGDRIHRALAEWYVGDGRTRVDPRTALERIIVEERELIALKFRDDPNVATIIAQLSKEDDLERAMVEGYVQWLADTGADADYEVIASERYEDAELPGLHGRGDVAVYIIAKLDAKVRRRTDGALLFIDHKTVADFASKIMLIGIDEQMLWYDLIELLTNTPLGERSAGAIYNMLRRVKRTVKARPPFYERHYEPHNRPQIDAFYRQLWGTIRDILELERKLDRGDNHHLVAYPSPQGDCSWSCDFRAVCPLFNDGSRAEAMIQNLYTAGDPLAYYYRDEVTNDGTTKDEGSRK